MSRSPPPRPHRSLASAQMAWPILSRLDADSLNSSTVLSLSPSSSTRSVVMPAIVPSGPDSGRTVQESTPRNGVEGCEAGLPRPAGDQNRHRRHHTFSASAGVETCNDRMPEISWSPKSRGRTVNANRRESPVELAPRPENKWERSEIHPSEARPCQGARGATPFARERQRPRSEATQGARTRTRGSARGRQPSRIGGFGGSSPRVQEREMARESRPEGATTTSHPFRVEVAGIEPASFSTESGLLRAQPV